jgi:bisphosphoglycerate-independent phosphoglycerate mutase (AlkP superfamily)
MSDGRVHANLADIIKTVKYIVKNDLRVCIHFIADGRDTPPKSALRYVRTIKRMLSPYFVDWRAFFGTLSGRYWTMDRNKNMDRTEMAFNAIAMAMASIGIPSCEKTTVKPMIAPPATGGTAKDMSHTVTYARISHAGVMAMP